MKIAAPVVKVYSGFANNTSSWMEFLKIYLTDKKHLLYW